jgi:signal transduction histidine kinase
MSESATSLPNLTTTVSAGGDGPRALVVDDDEALLLICVRAIALQGYRVEAAQDGESALRALRRTTFDVLVSDIRLPGMSGLELLEKLRDDGLDIPVVLMTGNPTLDSAMKAMDHGVLRYLAKPVEPRALAAVVNEVVRLHGIARADRLALDNDALQSLVEELRRSKEAALAGTQAKTAFLSKMGHELRAPMTTVIGMTELALGTALTPEARGYLETVRTAAESLIETIAHILEFSDLDAARLQLEPKPFNVRDVIDTTLKSLRPSAEAKGLSLISDVPPEIPDALVGDPVRFALILKALAGNAIKFTQAGEVRIRAQLEAHSGTDVRVCVSISDTGIGIQKEALSLVLEAFSQQDNSPRREFSGAGLGLTIASQLVALMKGTLEIESTPRVGTTVRFTVCLERVPAEDGFFMTDDYAQR